MYQINFSKTALKSLKKIPINYQIKFKQLSQKLTINPFSADIKKLNDFNLKATHRIRIGSYRIFLKIDPELKTIIIADIERRTSQTYH